MDGMHKILSTYEINPNTMIIIPKRTKHTVCSVIKEVDDEFVVALTPTEIIEQSCLFYGSSYRGRVIATQELIGITHKPPIAICPSNNIFFFPTTSAADNECTWVSHIYVKKAEKTNHKRTILHFTNHTSAILNISSTSFENQLYRTAHLITTFLSRQDFLKRPIPPKFEYVCDGEIDEYILKKKREARISNV